MSLRSLLLASAGLIAPACVFLAGPTFAADAPSPPKVEEVVITASPLGGDKDRFATIVENVSRDDILKSGGANLADALAETPGVTGTGFAGGASRPVIRGMDATRVKILEDGLSSSDVSDLGPDHGVPIDPLSAQKIEVVRGAATLRYGSQAIGGVVNAINNRIPLSLPTKPLSGEATASYDSVDDAGQGSLLFDGAVGRLALHADGSIRSTHDYDTPLGVQANSYFRGGAYALGASYFLPNDSRIGLAAVNYAADYGIPSDTTHIIMHQTKYLTGSSFKIGDGTGVLRTINVDASYADYKHSEVEPNGDVNSTFLNNEWDGRIEALLGKIGFLQASALGVQLQDRKFSALGDDSSYLFPTHTKSAAGFAFTEAELSDRSYLQAAIRVEHLDITGTPASNIPADLSFTPVSGSIGATFDATSDVKLGLTLSSTARSPAQSELFARGGHDGPETYETGNPNLGLERSNSLEGTLRWDIGGARVEASVWGSRFSHFIYGQLTGRTCDDDGACVANTSRPLRELNYVQADADFYGAEAKATVPVFKTSAGSLSADLLADTVRATLSNGLGNVPRLPPYRVGGGLTWTSDSFDANFLLMGVGRQDRPGFGDMETAGYASLDARIAWRPFAEHQGLELALVGKNLTDQIERNAVALNKDLVVSPGRDVRVVVRASF